MSGKAHAKCHALNKFYFLLVATWQARAHRIIKVSANMCWHMLFLHLSHCAQRSTHEPDQPFPSFSLASILSAVHQTPACHNTLCCLHHHFPADSLPLHYQYTRSCCLHHHLHHHTRCLHHHLQASISDILHKCSALLLSHCAATACVTTQRRVGSHLLASHPLLLMLKFTHYSLPTTPDPPTQLTTYYSWPTSSLLTTYCF